MRNDRGSILLFTLFSLLILTTLVYKVFSPFRQMVEESQAEMVRDRGLSYLYSFENVVRQVVPRVDLNFYRQIKRIKSGEPIMLTFPTPEGQIQGELSSINNCINITLSSRPSQAEIQALAITIKRLSQLVLHQTESGDLVVEALYPTTLEAGFFQQTTESDEGGQKIIPNRLDKNKQWALSQLRPYLCRQSKVGQHIDVNAIDNNSLPALQALLPESISEGALMKLYGQRGNSYWHTLKEFLHALPHSDAITPEIESMLNIQSTDFNIKFSYKEQGREFAAVSYFFVADQQWFLYRRSLIMDGSL